MDIKKTIAALTLEEKVALCSGQDFWRTKAIERLGIVSYMLTDGPHGLRKQTSEAEVAALHDSVPATCFPSGAGLAATWNRSLLEEVGEALGREARAEDVGVLLGPAINIKRSPLCGRNFEYFSEDPYLAGELAKYHVRGVQAQGVAACPKHFAANNQEKYRMLVDARVDARSLREIYLPAFESTVKDARPWTLMCAYNRLNGVYCAQSAWLLNQVLRDEWGYDGVVVSDWGAVDDRVESLRAGLELEMPGNGGITDRELADAVRAGKLDERVLDTALERLLTLYSRVQDGRQPGTPFDREGHHALARRVAQESLVLLKNSNELLPLPQAGRIAFIGTFAAEPRYQGGGSSHIQPTRVENALDAARELLAGSADVVFARGYDVRSSAPDPTLIGEAVELARGADAAVLFVGLTDTFESEGFDRAHLRIPESHVALIDAVAAVQPRTVVVLSNGSPIEMPWLPRVGAVLEGYLGGQAGGGAAADILFGEANPSGKLPETFPVRIQDTPSYLNFPGEKDRVEYREGLFVGYRHADSAEVEPLFPFGFGLSYTTFAYSEPHVDREELQEHEELTVSVRVKNTGKRAGQEVVQLYVRDEVSSVVRPYKELRAFEKVALEPGEEKEVRFNLGKRAFAFWDDRQHDWRVEPGEFTIFVGASSRDLRGRVKVTIRNATQPVPHWDQNSLLGDVMAHPVVGPAITALKNEFSKALGQYPPDSAEALMAEAVAREMPLRNVVRMLRGLNQEQLSLLLDVLNGATPPERLLSELPTHR
ncbi:MAG TPA: glycoside hydrolase family 3 C-terminal domain-containing protein [Polyangiaceae bacterium]|nr:glycoside hydrolase family 3 C-terminal domain-containing protein [Polyangiaceae bacterium]